MRTRRPERDLEVLWQRHIPGSRDERYLTEAIAGLLESVDDAVEELDLGLFADEDFVLTISRRPL